MLEYEREGRTWAHASRLRETEAVRQMNLDWTRASIANMTPAAMEVDPKLPPTATTNGKPLKSKVRQLKVEEEVIRYAGEGWQGGDDTHHGAGDASDCEE